MCVFPWLWFFKPKNYSTDFSQISDFSLSYRDILEKSFNHCRSADAGGATPKRTEFVCMFTIHKYLKIYINICGRPNVT